MRGEFVDLDDARLYCFAAGERGHGDPIVLVHGIFSSSHTWRDVVPRLPDGHRILVLDLLGHGRSDLPTDAALDVEAHADRMCRLLSTLGIASACLVGHGVGAAIALRVRQTAPSRVSGLLLCSPCLIGTRDHPARTPAPWQHLARTAPLFRALPPAWLTSMLHRTLLRGYRNRTSARHAVDVYLRPYRTPAGRTAACRQLQALARSRPATLDPTALAVPLHILCGDRDPFRARGADRAMAEAAPAELARTTTAGAETLVAASRRTLIEHVPDLAHALPEEAPDRVAAAVRALLAA
jgi:pimeloyl-ACP methyl ester carboxylesterase